MSTVHFVQAGGTIDKDYLATDEHHGYNFVIGDAAIHSILRRANLPYTTRFTCACQKDSLDMTDNDRDDVRAHVAASDAKKVVVLHGTDTIHVTARHLSVIPEKVIILTGAMIPERFRDSDADFNVGMAVGAISILEPGVYIALNGEVKPWFEFVPS